MMNEIYDYDYDYDELKLFAYEFMGIDCIYRDIFELRLSNNIIIDD